MVLFKKSIDLEHQTLLKKENYSVVVFKFNLIF
jgi:hypothetical protein